MDRLDVDTAADESMGKMSSREELFLVLKQNGLMILTLLGVVLGFGLGFGLRRYDLSDTALMWLGNENSSLTFLCGKGVSMCGSRGGEGRGPDPENHKNMVS